MALVLLACSAAASGTASTRSRASSPPPTTTARGTGEVHGRRSRRARRSPTSANTLVDADVVKSTKAFVEAAEDEPAQQEHPARHLQAAQADARRGRASTLLLDPKNQVVNGVTIPEGQTAKQTYEHARQGDRHPGRRLRGGGQGPEALGVPDYWFKRSDGKKVTKSVEGFLFPDTYEFEPERHRRRRSSKTMVEQFLTVTDEDRSSSTRCRPSASITPVRGADRGVAGPGRGGQRRGPRQGRPGRVQPASTGQTSRATACSSTSTVNYWLRAHGKPTKASKDMTAGRAGRPEEPVQHARQAGPAAGADQQPGQGRRWRAR